MTESFNDNTDRAFFPKGELRRFLIQIEQLTQKQPAELAALVNVCSRTFFDWKREKHSISTKTIVELCKLANLPFPQNLIFKPQYWYTSSAGSKGGIVQYQKNKSIGGSPQIRLNMWRRWWESYGKYRPHNTAILQRLPLISPNYSPDLAEFTGILLGDGGISKYQVTVTLHSKDDKEYVSFIKNLCIQLFRVNPAIKKRKNQNAVNIVISRADIVDFFINMGLVIGNKVQQQVKVPEWIQTDDKHIQRCIRGLIDTDGCFYVDHHKYKNKNYMNAGINFTNHSIPLLVFVKENLEKLNFHPTQKTPFSLFLRRESEIKRYFECIGTSNPKHFKKYKKYAILRRNGGVPKWS